MFLNLSRDECAEIVRGLVRLGFLSCDMNRKLTLLKADFATTNDIPSKTIRARHRNDWERAIRAIDEFDVSERMFTSIIFPTSAESVGEIKNEIARFVDRVAVIGGRFGKDRGYTFAACLHPVKEK